MAVTFHIFITTLTLFLHLNGIQGFLAPKTSANHPKLLHNHQKGEWRHTQSPSQHASFLNSATVLGSALFTDIPLLPNAFEEASSAYSYALTHYQIETQSLSTGFLSGLGDTIAQITEESNEDEKRNIKLQRTYAFIIKGLGAGIIWHFWYIIAETCGDYAFGFDHETYFVQRTVLSILLEQFIACPVVYALWDIPIPALINGSGLKSIPDRIRTRIGDLLFSNAKVWTFANVIIYNIPLEWRVLAMNVADLGWQVLMSQSLMEDKDEA